MKALLNSEQRSPLSTARYSILPRLHFWAEFFHSSVIYFTIGGAIFGLICGILSAIVIIRQRNPSEAAAMQARIGMVLGLPGALLVIVGAIAWLSRTF
jgi:hypothetical protein